jgi:hypothetical protein
MADLLELKDRVGRFLRSNFDDVRLTDNGDGFLIPMGEFPISVDVSILEDQQARESFEEGNLPVTTVHIRAWISINIKPSTEFYRFITEDLPETCSLQFVVTNVPGHKKKGAVISYVMPGDGLEAGEFSWAILKVHAEARFTGEALKEKFKADWLWDD